ncbi:serine/threonine protein kinase, partial [Myxococcota bacterium]|nr:serine/threonine protein kinase [Myxococcota bacterium]
MEADKKDQKYKIIKKLDSGGMAEVFLAEMETVKGFKKTVAIKRIRPSLIQEEKFVKMFMDEARLSLYLQHANIASIFDVGMSDKHFFIVMEYVEGLNLKSILELLQNPTLPPQLAVFIMQNVCEALHYAHTLKDSSSGKPFHIVHRDISPPNILISKAGEVKLVDFGLAKASSQDEKSEPGLIKGKYSYLSPEAAAGLEVDHRTDIFATGIILFELITGRRLFLGENNYETVLQVKEAHVPKLSSLVPHIHPELDRIVAKSLERDPEKRYMNASDMGDDLTQVLFTMGKAVTKRDISKYVLEALEIKKRQEPSMLISRDSLLKEFIEDEINQLISVGEIGDDLAQPGASPLDLGTLSGAELLKTEHAPSADTLSALVTDDLSPHTPVQPGGIPLAEMPREPSSNPMKTTPSLDGDSPPQGISYRTSTPISFT